MPFGPLSCPGSAFGSAWPVLRSSGFACGRSSLTSAASSVACSYAFLEPIFEEPVFDAPEEVTAGESTSVGSAELMLAYPVISVPGSCASPKMKNRTACDLFLD